MRLLNGKPAPDDHPATDILIFFAAPALVVGGNRDTGAMRAGVVACDQAGCVKSCVGRNGYEQSCGQYDGYNCECTPEVVAHQFSPSANIIVMTACHPRRDVLASIIQNNQL